MLFLSFAVKVSEYLFNVLLLPTRAHYMKKIILNLLIFLVMIAIGIGAAKLLKKNKKPITHDDSVMESKPVDVMTVRKQVFSAHVTAYGHIEPSIVLQGKAELSGKVS